MIQATPIQNTLGLSEDSPFNFPDVPLSFADFTLESAESLLGLTSQPADLFSKLAPLAPPAWLVDSLVRGRRHVMVGEKARSEFLVVPVLMAGEELFEGQISLYSGARLDVDPDQGLVGECDFILAAGPAVPKLSAPLLTIVEAKKNNIEVGIGQCVAQMVAAQLFNQRHNKPHRVIYGCVTTGELWQFLCLEDQLVKIDNNRLFIGNVGEILAVLMEILTRLKP